MSHIVYSNYYSYGIKFKKTAGKSLLCTVIQLLVSFGMNRATNMNAVCGDLKQSGAIANAYSALSLRPL
jgi:hypothetical protein